LCVRTWSTSRDWPADLCRTESVFDDGCAQLDVGDSVVVRRESRLRLRHTAVCCRQGLRTLHPGLVSLFTSPFETARTVKVKVKKGLDTCYSATYMSQTRDRQRFTISQVVADSLIGMSQWCRSALCGHPLPALTDNWTHGAASRHTIAPISHTRPAPRSRSYYSFPIPLRVGGG